ncbi:hypothetical protein N878_26040 [Pseudomonas sp. EGD-AK9]|nr:hypothetical protein N878_26040 [Pseudomonas sp. EGD-AK9]
MKMFLAGCCSKSVYDRVERLDVFRSQFKHIFFQNRYVLLLHF